MDNRWENIGEVLLNAIFVPLWVAWQIIAWILNLLGNFALAILKNFYGRLVVFFGGILFFIFIQYFDKFFK